jgi:hypothetical protein
MKNRVCILQSHEQGITEAGHTTRTWFTMVEAPPLRILLFELKLAPPSSATAIPAVDTIRTATAAAPSTKRSWRFFAWRIAIWGRDGDITSRKDSTSAGHSTITTKKAVYFMI